MASKFELTISVNYASNWGITEAVREFIQNARDEQVQNSDNKMFLKYDRDNQKFIVGNKNSVLNINSLLLGVTSKENSNDTIGQFGEGYKIATTVLLRLGKSVTFYNYAMNEIWTTKLVRSRRYGGELVPTFYVEKATGLFKSRVIEDYSLIIEIEDIDDSEYEDIKESVLYLQDSYSKDKTPYGEILTDDKYKGKVFVSGLYVCTNSNLNRGYNFNPDQIKLGRDRNITADFDIKWTASRMLSHINSKDSENLYKLSSTFDGQYIPNFISSDIRMNMATRFIEENGNDAYPVSDQEEYDEASKAGLKPIYVSDTQKSLLLASNKFIIKYNGLKDGSLYDKLIKFVEDISDRLEPDEEEYIHELLESNKSRLNNQIT